VFGNKTIVIPKHTSTVTRASRTNTHSVQHKIHALNNKSAIYRHLFGLYLSKSHLVSAEKNVVISTQTQFDYSSLQRKRYSLNTITKEGQSDTYRQQSIRRIGALVSHV
jgi:hypothetical protein